MRLAPCGDFCFAILLLADFASRQINEYNNLYKPEFIFNKTLYALSAIYYSAVIARSVTTKQSIKEHGNWIASPQAVRNSVSINR
jgi:hypothetical protein